MIASPPFKISGGKRQLLYRLMDLAPKVTATYFEPFVGGGALFWALAAEGRFRRAVLSDANPELVRTWQAIQRNHVGVLRELDGHKHTEKHYYRTRAKDPAKLTDEACAARFIYLNKSGFNGLIRYNASGEFNVPFGKQPKMEMFASPELLKACAAALNAKPVTIVCADFEDVTRKMRLGDWGYFDPPYAPVSKTSSFTAYTPGGFTTADQCRLAKWFTTLDARGVSALLSNSSCDLTERLYGGFQIERIMAKRAINSDPEKRGAIKEILVMTAGLRAQNTIR